MASRLQCAVALFVVATSFIVSDAARALKQDASIGVTVYGSNNANSPPTVDLGAAKNFTVLAYATVTNTGSSTVGGLLGVSPGSAVTGEADISYSSAPTPNGRANKVEADAAKADVTTAYNDAKGRVEDVILINVTNIGGATFKAGLYKSNNKLEVSTGDLYLSGSADDVFIFQIAESLEMSSGLKMVLQDGAQAKNVFWQIGTSANFAVGSAAVGNMLAYAAISVSTGATVEGRLFAITEAVTMDSNSVIYPN